MHRVELLHEIPDVQRTISIALGESLDYFFVLIAREPMERRLTFTLADGATVHVKGIVLASEGAEVHLITDTIHAGRMAEGSTLVKGIVTDRARVQATGLIRIPETGQGASAFLEQRFLLLSENTRAKAEPMLEILANDLKKVGHAASVSRLNYDQLFYCASRGIDFDAGRRLFAEAFVNAIVDTIPEEHARIECYAAITKILT